MLAALAASTHLIAQDWAKERLEKSPRHQEWIKVKRGDKEISCFVVFPEVSGKAPSVVVIHEIFGLTDWVRTVADRLAEEGAIAIAPDLLSGKAPGGGGSDKFPGVDGARKAVSGLSAEEVQADLKAVADHISHHAAANGKVAVAGFCWGGAQSFRLATNLKDLKASLVFYGTAPEKDEDLARIGCPVYGFYGGDDARVTATVEDTVKRMKKASKTYEPVTYPGAGHGFMRAGEEPNAKEANKKARDEAWKRIKEILKKL
jgi:carboxymethylenebutenolidase